MFLQARIQIKRRLFPLEFHKRSQSLEHLTMKSWNNWSEWINDLTGLPHFFYSSIALQILIVLRKIVSDKDEAVQDRHSLDLTAALIKVTTNTGTDRYKNMKQTIWEWKTFCKQAEIKHWTEQTKGWKELNQEHGSHL